MFTTVMNDRRSVSQKIGWIVFLIGAIYMLGLGWLYSWWMVPAANQSGPAAIAGLAGWVWGLSVPLGAFIVAFGAALIARAEGRTILLLTLILIVMVFWQATQSISEIVPALFGIGGGLITLFFIGSAWHWSRVRPALSPSARMGADLSMLGLVFFVEAAWNLCGILGMGNYVLRPELADKFAVPLASTINIASRVLILLVLGWGFTFFGQLNSRHAYAVEQNRKGLAKEINQRGALVQISGESK